MYNAPKECDMDECLYVKELKKAIAWLGMLAYRKHDYCEQDAWYSCPKSEDGCSNPDDGTECNCGAEAHNKKVNAFLKEIEAI